MDDGVGLVENGDYMLVWSDEDGEGAVVGQDHGYVSDRAMLLRRDQARKSGDWNSYSYWVIEIASAGFAKDHPSMVEHNRGGWAATSAASFKKFASAMRAALKAARHEFDSGRPMPEWATRALENGWKPPRGWKP